MTCTMHQWVGIHKTNKQTNKLTNKKTKQNKEKEREKNTQQQHQQKQPNKFYKTKINTLILLVYSKQVVHYYCVLLFCSTTCRIKALSDLDQNN